MRSTSSVGKGSNSSRWAEVSSSRRGIIGFSKTFVYEKWIQPASNAPKRSLLGSRKPFLIRFSRFFIFDTSIENLMPKRELQPLRIGYARVSTHDQSLEMQLDALKKTGCKRIFTDKLSGAQVEPPGLKEALSQLRESDTLVVWKLDRLGRSVKGLVDLVNELQTQRVHFQSITDGIDTKTPAGRFFFHVMASLAQMERELILERTRAGLEAARRQGRVGGRKRRMTDGKVQAARKLLASGTSPCEVAHSLGVSVPTLYRWVPASSRT